MHTYTVTFTTTDGYIVSVHHKIKANSEKDAITIAKRFHPPKAGYNAYAKVDDS